MDENQKQPLLIRAAQYVRTATVSPNGAAPVHSQSVAIREFAARNGYEIVRTYADLGKGGLTLDGRDALQQMFQAITSGEADFAAVLLYDISRWGRAEEIMDWCETVCNQHGIRVEYCAEPPADHIPFSALCCSWFQHRPGVASPVINESHAQAHDVAMSEEPVAHG